MSLNGLPVQLKPHVLSNRLTKYAAPINKTPKEIEDAHVEKLSKGES